MTASFPHHYHVTLDLDGRLTAPPRAPIVGGVPPQFGGGSDRVWSPEELLVGAANLCLMTTFRVFAQKQDLTVRRYDSRGDGTLDKTSAGLVFTRVDLTVELVVAVGQEDAARAALDRAAKHCIVANSLRCPVEVKATVVGL